ncbi:MAG: DNA polymerase III subunit gamma/tau [Planctomycetota bacterium]|nr:MAG: DNA polymerase III subunit gamma/tau [Planctomycetota bacterium]
MAASEGKTTDSPTPPLAASSRPNDYVVVARRYRPKTFEELIGQDPVAKALKGAIAANRVGHAYLFTGARGVGKTSTARILAKALNCVHGPTPTPCNECDICTSISSGNDVDVLEIDGASNRGIDEIRQLRQNVSIRPSRARFKIYIIDEVHMLTREAFNALLKTLEEPPEHVKFIFCTTEAAKIPVTILSRCQRFDFAGIHLPSIVERLSQIAAAEGIEAESEALELLARRAGGSMRDSQSLLEQLLAVGENKITVSDVHSLLGTAGEAQIQQLVDRLVEHDTAGALAALDEAASQGVDIGQLVEQLLGYFRDVMTAAAGCPPATLMYSAAAQHERLSATGKQLGLETTLAIMQVLDHTLSRLRYSTQVRTLAEMALVRIANLETLDDLAGLLADMRSGASGAIPPAGSARSTPPSSLPAKKKDEPESPQAPEHTSNGHAAACIELTPESVADVWKEALAGLSGLLADNASLCQSVSLGAGGRLVATFGAKYTSCKAFCERPEQLSTLSRALSDVAGKPVNVEFHLAADEPSAARQKSRPVGHRQRLAEMAEHPMVRKATELFDARLVNIEEPREHS